MGLFVDTTGTTVDLDELGITLTHPTVDFDLGSKFTARMLRESFSLTNAIIGGTLNWKKTSGGSIEPNAEYDPDLAMADELNLGIGLKGDRVVTFKDLTSDNITGASPGFSFGDSGNINNAFLLNETVPSNKSGRPILLDNPEITRVAVTNETTGTFDVQIFEHDKVTFTLKHTINVVAAKTQLDEGLSISLTKGKELAAKIVIGAAKNPLVVVILRGDA